MCVCVCVCVYLFYFQHEEEILDKVDDYYALPQESIDYRSRLYAAALIIAVDKGTV